MDQVQEKGLQTIVRNRKKVYIVLTKEQYDLLVKPATSLVDFFLSAPYSEVDLDITRSQETLREFEI
jgi:hypothetical protein